MNQKKIIVVGSGTAGLITALIIKSAMPEYKIIIVSSSNKGIIGVGEGSTEHWQLFQNIVGINVDDMVRNADITHKYGIRYENWTNHTPDYFHSVGGTGLQSNTFWGSYAYALENDLLLTNTFSWRGLVDNMVIDNGPEVHRGTNQYHFDTFKLNKYLTNIAADKGINFIDDEVTDVSVENNGFIESVFLKDAQKDIYGDFFIDATGFHRELLSKIADKTFISYRKFLPCDKAIAFPTESEESGQIKPYTRARALKNGWMWEIPTQTRRGNGYVFASDFCSAEQAIEEASEVHGFQVEPAKILDFNSGYFKETWKNNCVAVGLAAGFVEPLEATSISTTIQQARLICSYLPTFSEERMYGIKEYHRVVDSIMENILCMISLHYMSDRTDSEMWRAQGKSEKPELLQHLLNIWNERCPESHDVPSTGFELFGAAHLWHVAQGQGVLNKQVASMQLDAYASRKNVSEDISNYTKSLLKQRLIGHAQALKNTRNS
jgi:tryptophan 7-halogenase